MSTIQKLIVASDSFKGTLSSIEIGEIVAKSFSEAFPNIKVKIIPMADGGEGTVDSLIKALGAKEIRLKVHNALGESIEAKYAIHNKTAIIEMAEAAGLPKVKEKKPLDASTYGVGELVNDALKHDVDSILLGLGGSATNDGGCGAAYALGTKFYDDNNQEFMPTGKTLEKIRKIDNTVTSKKLKNVKVTIMCDVNNPLCGDNGAAKIYGPQKGATEEDIKIIDDGLRNLAKVIKNDLKIDILNEKGAGAAGGMGGGSLAFFKGELKSGIESLLEVTNFDKELEDTDLVISGEAILDGQSLEGKVISGIGEHCKKKHVPLYLIVAAFLEEAKDVYKYGVTKVFITIKEQLPLSIHMLRAREEYEDTVLEVIDYIKGEENEIK